MSQIVSFAFAPFVASVLAGTYVFVERLNVVYVPRNVLKFKDLFLYQILHGAW